MDIPVENADSFGIVFFLGNSGCDADIVEEAKASDLVIVRVMAWRAYDGEGIVHEGLRAHVGHSLHRAATRHQCRLFGPLVHVGVHLGCPLVLASLQSFSVFPHVSNVPCLVG